MDEEAPYGIKELAELAKITDANLIMQGL